MAGKARTTPPGVTPPGKPGGEAVKPPLQAPVAPPRDTLADLLASELSTDHEAPGKLAANARAEAELALLDLLSTAGERPHDFDFFHLVRRLEVLWATARAGPVLGKSVRASEDVVRFSQEPSLAFAPRTIGGVKTRAGITRFFVNFMGLLGPHGPMPAHLTDYVYTRQLHHADPTLARFFDIFNHRMVSLFYRAWAMNRPAVNYDRSALPGADEAQDDFARYCASLIGIGMEHLRGRDALPDRAKLYYSGRLVGQTRNPEGLIAMIADYFGVQSTIEEFVGRWFDLPAQYHTRLGNPATAALGQTALAGGRVWNCQSVVRLRLGPMGLTQYERLLPGGPAYSKLAAWIKLFAGPELAWEAKLTLKQAEIPRAELGRGVRLGWTTWVTTKPLGRDPEDVTLHN